MYHQRLEQVCVSVSCGYKVLRPTSHDPRSTLQARQVPVRPQEPVMAPSQEHYQLVPLPGLLRLDVPVHVVLHEEYAG